jgi:hypothetical protein
MLATGLVVALGWTFDAVLVRTSVTMRSVLTNRVIAQSVSRKSMMLTTNWLSAASSSGVSTEEGGRIALSSV